MKLPVSRRIAAALLIGFLTGVFWLVAVRFFVIQSSAVHYHANFALYIDGVQDMFSNFNFYEEVQACGGDELDNPKSRVHMHGHVNHVVHVHDHGATWGHFFANLGYSLSDKALTTDKAVFADGQDDKRLSFLVNGEMASSLSNRLIKSEDVVLINYGSEDADTLQQRLNAIPKDAHEANTKPDPASCSGQQALSFTQRLRKAFGFGD